jgi:hypothetical protein
MKPSDLVERLLSEIAMVGDPADDNFVDDREGDPDMLASVDRDMAQEEKWYEIANDAGITPKDLQNAAIVADATVPKEAITRAETGAGVDFPRRGSWSGELVWLYLALRERNLIDTNGNPT